MKEQKIKWVTVDELMNMRRWELVQLVKALAKEHDRAEIRHLVNEVRARYRAAQVPASGQAAPARQR